jgi:hypothetical protein
MSEEKNRYVEPCRDFLSMRPRVDSSEDGSGYVVNEEDLAAFVKGLFDEDAKKQSEAMKSFVSKPGDITRRHWAPLEMPITAKKLQHDDGSVPACLPCARLACGFAEDVRAGLCTCGANPPPPQQQKDNDATDDTKNTAATATTEKEEGGPRD